MRTRTATWTLAAALALGGLGAAPAAAIQHEISGSFAAQFVVSNFNNTPVTENYAYAPEGLPADPGTSNFFEQRLRLGYTAKASDKLKLVTKFELDFGYYGDASYGVGANEGAALGGDQVNLETKWVYLDAVCPVTGTNFKIGLQEYIDGFEGALIWADAAGVVAARPFGALNLSLGFFRLFDNGEENLGDETADLLALDASFQLSENLKVGGAYYLVMDDLGEDSITAHTVGVNGKGTFGAMTLNGYALYQFGDAGGGQDISAWAANAGLEMALGPGTLRSEVQYASGDADAGDDEVNSLFTYYGEYWYGSHSLALLTRDDYALTADNGVVYDVAFGGRGSLIASAGYDLPFGKKTTLSCNVGAGWAAEDYDRQGALLGVEGNVRLAYTVAEGLTLTARAAYLGLGDYYDGVAAGGDDPDNPFDIRVIVGYSF